MTDLKERILQANIELHRREAGIYDRLTPEIFNAHEQALVHTVLEHALAAVSSPVIRALDIGTGTGNISLKLAAYDRVSSVFAVDLSAEMVAQQERKLTPGLREKITFQIQDADSFLERSAQLFDIITVSSVLHHLPDYMATLTSLMSRLAPGGALCIFHEPTGAESKVLRALEWLDSRLYARLFLDRETLALARSLDYSLSDYHVFHGFKLDEIRKNFSDHGYTELFFLKHNVFKTGLLRLLGRFVPQKNNFILAVKKSA